MKTITAIAIFSFIIFVGAEPPPPQNNYLPPQNNYLPPQNNYLPPQNTMQAPVFTPVSNGYKAPQQNFYAQPHNSYIPPNTNVKYTSQSIETPTNLYGTPSNAQSNNYPTKTYQAPSTTYGAPTSSYEERLSTLSNYQTPAITSVIFKPQNSLSSIDHQNLHSNENNGYNYLNNNGGNNGQINGEYENNAPAQYSFEYNVLDYPSGNDFGHMESRNGDKTVGKYYVLLPDGRKQIVTYEADENGYRPVITYEDTNAANGYPNSQQSSNNNDKFNGY